MGTLTFFLSLYTLVFIGFLQTMRYWSPKQWIKWWIKKKFQSRGWQWPPSAEITRKYGWIVSLAFLIPLLFQAQNQICDVKWSKDELDERKENESEHRRDVRDMICDQIQYKISKKEEEEEEEKMVKKLRKTKEEEEEEEEEKMVKKLRKT